MNEVQRGMEVVAKFIEELADVGAAQHDSTLAKVFRGHANGQWHLTPSAFRPGGERGIRNDEALQRWIRMASPVVPTWPQNQIEWIALAQHHGIPTGLLDWSLNPLIGLYFASGKHPKDAQGPGHAGCVWMLDTTKCDQFTHTLMVDPFQVDCEKPAFLPVLGANLRAKAQFGAMTLHATRESDQGARFPEGCVRKVFELPAADKHPVRRALGVLGIASRTVFGDLEAAADDFRNRVMKLGK